MPDGRTLRFALNQHSRQSPPTFSQPILDGDLGVHHGCALLEEGSIACWGADPDGLGLLDGPP